MADQNRNQGANVSCTVCLHVRPAANLPFMLFDDLAILFAASAICAPGGAVIAVGDVGLKDGTELGISADILTRFSEALRRVKNRVLVSFAYQGHS